MYCTDDRLSQVSRIIKTAAHLAFDLGEQAIPNVRFSYVAPRKDETYFSHLAHHKIGGTSEDPLTVETVSGISIHPLLVAKDAQERILGMSFEQRQVYEKAGYARSTILARNTELAALGIGVVATVQALHNIIGPDEITEAQSGDQEQRRTDIAAILEFVFRIHEFPK